MSRYEQLRAAVLGGCAGGGRAHALLQQRGMAWWVRAWQQTSRPCRAVSQPELPLPDTLPQRSGELTRLLAGMALNAIRKEKR